MQLDPATRIALEQLYSLLLSVVVVLARVLGQALPGADAGERRSERSSLTPH